MSQQLTIQQAQERLQAGHARFLRGEAVAARNWPELQTFVPMESQMPFAVVLGCSDSRIIPEQIFDETAGQLFVVRVAGHVPYSSQIASIEYAVENFATPLVLVLGHSRCGAVQATFDNELHPASIPSRHVSSLLEFIRPSVQSFLLGNEEPDAVRLLPLIIRENVHQTLNHLYQESSLLQEAVNGGKLLFVGAYYSVETGSLEYITA